MILYDLLESCVVLLCCLFFLMIRRPPRSTLDRSSAASDVYKRQGVAALVYLFTPGDFWTNTIITASVIIVLHAVNAYVIEPKIIGHKLGLHPVILLASLFICAHLFGFLGLLFGVPLAAIIVSFINEWWIDKDVVI